MSTGAKWIKEHPERLPIYRQRRREKHAQMREAVLDLLGRMCACCGHEDSPFLSVDHINNDAHKEREAGVRGSYMVYHRILHDPNAKTKYQTLCYSCNMAKARNGGACPHRKMVIAYGWCV